MNSSPSSYKHFALNIDDQSIAWLTIDVAGRSVNVLAQEVMEELGAVVRGAAVQGLHRGLVQDLLRVGRVRVVGLHRASAATAICSCHVCLRTR